MPVPVPSEPSGRGPKFVPTDLDLEEATAAGGGDAVGCAMVSTNCL